MYKHKLLIELYKRNEIESIIVNSSGRIEDYIGDTNKSIQIFSKSICDYLNGFNENILSFLDEEISLFETDEIKYSSVAIWNDAKRNYKVIFGKVIGSWNEDEKTMIETATYLLEKYF